MLGKKNRARCLIHISGDAHTKRLQKVKEDVSKLRGVLMVDVSHITGILSVEYDPGEVTIDQIRGAAENLDED